MKTHLKISGSSLLLTCAGLLCSPTVKAAELKLLLPLNRTAYQCNEWIDLSVARAGAAAQATGELALALQGEDGSALSFVFPADRAELRSVAHLHVNGWLLRPGPYRVEVNWDGGAAVTNITVYPALRRSDFKLVNWGRAQKKDQLAQGEDSLGFNVFYGGYSSDEEANFLRAGVDFIACCVMGGGHQMDLRTECDWSDPYVIRGGTRRVVRRAFIDRTRPNVLGIHFYDEPGLTWHKHPQTGDWTAHGVPWQARSYEAACGQPPLAYHQVNPNQPEDAARWRHWALWKLGFMDAAWQDAQFGVSWVKPEYISLTQSQYGYSAFTDGYYFNVVRSLPVISGHGGYHDFGPGYFNPSMFLEFARARDITRPNWYLPTWFGNTSADEFRLEQYLSFQCNLQGMIAPPDLELGSQPEKSPAAQGIVESNHLMARLGAIFGIIPVTRPPVALLFSLSQMVHAQTLDRTKNYAHDTLHGRNVPFVYLAGKLLQHQFMPVLDEDVLDGTLRAQHRAIILTSLDYLDPAVIGELESFAGHGGLVLVTPDSQVNIEGEVKLSAAPQWPDAEAIIALKKAGKDKEAGELQRLRQALAGARQFAEVLRPHLEQAGIRPPLASSEPGLVVTRQAAGDIEYLFAVNATHDPAGNPMLGLKAVGTVLKLPADGRPVYDVVHGGSAAGFAEQSGALQGAFRFGPGQMRVFARTARPMGAVTAAQPVLRRDYTLAEAPLRVDLSAAVLSVPSAPSVPPTLLSAAVPLRIRVTDSLGTTRYDLYRATDRGSLNLSLPLALNDPPGLWRVTITELLKNTSATTAFELTSFATGSAAAGATWRAAHWREDRDRIFRFFRTHQKITLVTGAAQQSRDREGASFAPDFHRAATARLEKILKPWNITCSTLTAAEANQPRPLTGDEAATWIGLDYAGKGQIKPGASNSPAQAGFALQGPALLLGTPEDNPLIKFLRDQKFLPYQPVPGSFPGPGRGYVAWQRDALGPDQESIALIAEDASGMEEAVGTLYEFAAGLQSLRPLSLPRASAIVPATRASVPAELKTAWSTVLPDRIVGLQATGEKLLVLTHDRTLTEMQQGKISTQKILDAAEYAKMSAALKPSTDPILLAAQRKQAPPTRLVKFALQTGDAVVVAYWGGTLALFDRAGALKATRAFPQDLTALAWSAPHLLVGDADGVLTAFRQ